MRFPPSSRILTLFLLIIPAVLHCENKSLVQFAESIGAALSYDPLTGTGSIERGGSRVAFKRGFSLYSFDGAGLRSLPPLTLESAIVIIPESTATAVLAWFTQRDEDAKSHFKVAAILIDPGHGGKDPGAIGEHTVGGKTFRILEKDIALDISRRIVASLKKRYPERIIMMTREDDTYPSLEERVEKANNISLGPRESVIYLSVHANASFNKNAAGFEVWYLDPDIRRTVVDPGKTGPVDPSVLKIWNTMMEEEFTTESIMLANRISSRLGLSIGSASKNRGVRAEQWFVVKNAKMPSVLVEVGFVTQKDEAILLGNPAHLSKIGDAVYNGVVDFIESFEQKGGNASP